MMENNIVEILSQIVDGILQNYTLEEVETKLLKNRKYQKATVATAYSWIYDKLFANSIRLRDDHIPTHGIRIPSDDETELLGVDNYNRLLKLRNIGFLTDEDLNLIMDQILLFPIEELTQEEINIILFSSLFELDRFIAPGSRTILSLKDNIN